MSVKHTHKCPECSDYWDCNDFYCDDLCQQCEEESIAMEVDAYTR